MNHEKTIYLDGKSLTIEDILNIAEKGYKVAIPESIKIEIIKKRNQLDEQLKKYPEIKIYGTNCLHGDLKYVDVDVETLEKYQWKYINVHNCATGNPLPIKVVRAMMVIRLNSFAKALSGMRWETIQLMMDMLNKGITPLVLEEGSVGASGDLVPLAMISAVLIGLEEAQAYYGPKGKEELLFARDALNKAGLEPTTLGAKEAMGLTNGSNFIAAMSVFAIRDAENLIKNASIAGALSLEAIRGEKDAFSETINNNRPHNGQLKIAKQISKLIDKSKRLTPEAQLHPFTNEDEVNNIKSIIEQNVSIFTEEQSKTLEKLLKEKEGDVRVQDRYSFRGIPQVHGVTLEALDRVKEVIEIEINSATDNPLFEEVSIEEMKVGIKKEIFEKLQRDGVKKLIKGFSGANFHGQPLAAVIDYLKITLTSVSLISDKRSFSLLDERLSYGLPADLAYNTEDADGGLMIVQYAGAARAAENRVLSTPASVMSISTAANQEDFVSMGNIGAVHLHKIIHNLQVIIAVELLCALRGIQLTFDKLPDNLRSLGNGTKIVYDYLSKDDKLPVGKENVNLKDHYLRKDMDKMIEIVSLGELVDLLPDVFKEEKSDE